jgi:hypothetical protein
MGARACWASGGKKVAWEGERAITAAWVGWAEIKGRFIIGFKFRISMNFIFWQGFENLYKEI